MNMPVTCGSISVIERSKLRSVTVLKNIVPNITIRVIVRIIGSTHSYAIKADGFLPLAK